MTPTEIVMAATRDGVVVALTHAGTLKVSGEHTQVQRWANLIRDNKPAIVAALEVAANEPTVAAPAWLLSFPDRDPLEVHFIHAATRAEALAAYPSATAAAPLPKLAEEPERSCRGCRHFRRPGLSGGYCGGDRPDLSPAYGPGHSLRRLPIDGGASCLNWEGPSNA